jgi:hypothetical protein
MITNIRSIIVCIISQYSLEVRVEIYKDATEKSLALAQKYQPDDLFPLSAFKIAQKRDKRLYSVDKANVLECTQTH